MLEKLIEIKAKYEELTRKAGDPQIIARQDEWRRLMKEHSRLTPIIEAFDAYNKQKSELDECQNIIANSNDRDLVLLAEEEAVLCRERLAELDKELKILLLPPDPNDDKNVIVEIRAGAGGDEAGLFGMELMRMYRLFAERNRWVYEDISGNISELGGVKEAVFSLSGAGVYAKMKFESGVHRVQRVPETETQGRVHTSTVTVAVLPEAEEVSVEINEKDLKIDTYRSGGAGGQHVNKTESAIRITHLPTGLVVTCEDERSQIKNRDKAMKVLRARLYDMYQSEANAQYAATRKGQVGTGDRSERIRTYNYPQGRVTDHRIGLTLYSLPEFLSGNLAETFEALRLADQTEKLNSI